MVKLYFLLLLIPVYSVGQRNSFTMEDLLAVSSISPKQVDNFLNKRGFHFAGDQKRTGNLPMTYLEKSRKRDFDSAGGRTLEIFMQDKDYCLRFQTISAEEYIDGKEQLKKAGFICDPANEATATNFRFRKRNLIVDARQSNEDGQIVYDFLLQKKELPPPSSITYADDLLKFDSHEYLLSYFGEAHVKKDVFYFTEKELRKCTILFGNTSQQAVFVWDDEQTLSGISFILISGLLPTQSAVEYSGNISQNTWVLRNGIHTGMRLKDLIILNGNDFNFFGNKSEFSLMVEPKKTGELDFGKTGVMLTCFDIHSPFLTNTTVSAQEAVEKGLAMYVGYVMIAPNQESGIRN